MRILVDARTGWGSGIGRYIVNTLPRLAAMKPALQFDIIVNPADTDEAYETFRSVDNTSIIENPIRSFTMQEQINLHRLAKGYDLTWFTNYWVPQFWPGQFIATVHDLLHLRADLFPASPVKRAMSWLTFHKLARSAAGLSFVSRFSRREFEDRFGPVRHSCVQYNGINHQGWQLFDPLAPPAKERLILAVGAAKQHKNFDILFDAWNCASLPPGWSMTVISPDANLRSGVDLEVLTRGRRPFTLRRGVSNAELHDLYAKAAIFLMPSLYEGFGLPLMEAMQAGALCIASPAESMVEIASGAFVQFVNGRDVEGWTAAMENMCRLIDSADFDFSSVQRHNMIHATKYNWHTVAENMSALIDDVLAL